MTPQEATPYELQLAGVEIPNHPFTEGTEPMSQTTGQTADQTTPDSARVTTARVQAGFSTVEDLARYTHLTASYLAAVESGEREVTQVQWIRILSSIQIAAQRRDAGVVKRGARPPQPRTPRPRSPRDDTPEWKMAQIEALGRSIAIALWEGCDDSDYMTMLLNQTLRERENEIWSSGAIASAAGNALRDLAEAIHLRMPIRDKFPMRELMAPNEIIP